MRHIFSIALICTIPQAASAQADTDQRIARYPATPGVVLGSDGTTAEPQFATEGIWLAPGQGLTFTLPKTMLYAEGELDRWAYRDYRLWFGRRLDRLPQRRVEVLRYR